MKHAAARVTVVTLGVAAVWAAVWFSTGWAALLATLILLAAVWYAVPHASSVFLRKQLLVGVAGAWIPVILIVALLPGGCADEFPVPFSAALWRSGALRQSMVDSIVDSERLNGLAVDAVHALLGPPDDQFPDDREEYWRVGADRSLGFDSEWLVVNYDESGRVYFVHLWTD